MSKFKRLISVITAASLLTGTITGFSVHAMSPTKDLPPDNVFIEMPMQESSDWQAAGDSIPNVSFENGHTVLKGGPNWGVYSKKPVVFDPDIYRYIELDLKEFKMLGDWADWKGLQVKLTTETHEPIPEKLDKIFFNCKAPGIYRYDLSTLSSAQKDQIRKYGINMGLYTVGTEKAVIGKYRIVKAVDDSNHVYASMPMQKSEYWVTGGAALPTISFQNNKVKLAGGDNYGNYSTIIGCFDPAVYPYIAINIDSFNTVQDWGEIQLKLTAADNPGALDKVVLSIKSPGNYVFDLTQLNEAEQNALRTHGLNFGLYTIGGATVDISKMELNKGYRVAFDTNGGSTLPDISIKHNQKLTAPTDPSKSGYVFDGWYSDKLLTQKWQFSEQAVTADMTLYAKWTVANYTVSFNLGDAAGTAPENQTIAHNNLVAKPADPIWEGREFLGWFAPGQTTAWDFTADKVTQNIVLTAKWKQQINKVHFNLNGATGTAPSSMEVTYGERILAPTAPVWDGYTFNGWFKEADCINAWQFTVDTVTQETTLYAKWTRNRYTITLPTGTGYTIVPATGFDTEVESGENFNFEIKLDAAYNKSNLIIKANGQPLTAQAGVYTIANIQKNQTVTVEGVEQNTYTITFHAEGVQDIIKTVKHGETLTDIPQPNEKMGYSATWDRENFENITSDLTITAVYTKIVPAPQTQKIIDKIASLGNITLDSKQAIEALRADYNALDESQKALVYNLDILVDAENTLRQLEEAAAKPSVDDNKDESKPNDATPSTGVPVASALPLILIFAGIGVFAFHKKQKNN